VANKYSAAQDVLLRIQEDIIGGKIQEGETITERWLEQRYGVSRTPIKEALKQLNLEGWVEITPRHETRVTRFSIDELREALPIRISLENIAIRLCIQRMNDKKRKDFEQLLKEFEMLQDKLLSHEQIPLSLYNDLDNNFHNMIYSYSESKMLSDFNMRLRSMLKRTYRRIPLDEMRISTGMDEIIHILRAILNGDIITAEANITKHVINSIDQKIKMMETGNFITQNMSE
jgi:DNA-binding GntR family transcriptional regulator